MNTQLSFATFLPLRSRSQSLHHPSKVTPVTPPNATATNFPFHGQNTKTDFHRPQVNPLFPFQHAHQKKNPPTHSASPIHLLASDLDGTLLTSSKLIHPHNVHALLKAISSGLIFIPATGKSRIGAIRAMDRLGTHLQQSSPPAGRFPGIFLNGLLVFGANGRLIFEQALTSEHALFILEQAERMDLTVLFYAGDDVLVRERTKETDMFIVSHEPVPIPVGDLTAAVQNNTIHKALLVDPRGDVIAYRPELEIAFRGLADITQARPDVLEVLPVGASKGAGFVRLLGDLGVKQEHALAIGDGENDIEMIKAAGLGVAVENSVPELFRVADHVVCGHDDAAVADAIRKFVSVVQ